MPILLSLLIPSLPQRLPQLTELLACLEAQADPRLEVLVLLDNRTRSLGEKRNALIREAHGKFIANIDDDEMLSPDYFAQIAPVLEEDVDLVAYDATVTLNGGNPFRVITGMGFENEQPKNDGKPIKRTPWHWCAWRRELALRCKFPEWHDAAEDAYWLKQALPLVGPWRKLDAAIFHHRYSASGSTFGGPQKK